MRLRFAAAEQLESTSSSLESDRVQLVTRLRQEFHERSSVLNEAMITFSNIVEELYGESGQLEFHATNNGPEFRIAIQGDRSRGINNMEIFCFDMMVQRMCKRQQMGTGFVVHDSHLFDGVDSRQTGRALILGARYAAQNSFQYIVTLNSDMCAELPDNIREFAIPTRLTDATDDGGLFGIRFEPPRPNGEDTPRRRRVASGED